MQSIATTDRTVAPFSWDHSHFLRSPSRLSGERRGVQGAHVVLCFVGIQGLPTRTVGQRVPRVIWQKMQVELFAEQETCDSPSRVCRTTGGACLLVVDTVASCGIEADHLV